MKKLLYIIPIIAIAAIIIIKLKSNKNEAQKKVYHFNKEQTITVQADTLKWQLANTENFFTGTFEPNKETKLSAETQGKINTIYVDAGSFVRRGQPVIKLDDALLKLQLQSIDVQIEGLETDVKRYTILSNADAIQGVQLEKAVLGLKSAKVQRSTLLEQINKSTITSPFDGIVTMKLTEIGAFAAPGTPLLQITDIHQLRFTVNMPESDLSLFKTNQTYSVKSDVYPDLHFPGKIILIGSKSNVANSYPVQFLVANTADLTIKSGMFGKVLVSTIKNKESLIINSSAIVGSGVQPQVYLIKDGKAVLQNIVILNRIQNKVIVKSGLKEGDVIITNGFINLFDGANVFIKN
ncbi:MAG: efflux RND transporter periplasmic adaptor subunit [Sediminibacterium sp.]|nr:efflux RND transporter periplasmic adaptor subunit [Sediminibacterium sp.]MDP1810421.1 efflux RND transporter periplasmic adaptor subunit [Sediminibacterium sp.]MDP3129054.1 efflux RND transporter periplasmic adaptor subunit [Sediminibacterium sp.]MDP3668047.1 efflux RND transporter periplasmic adaptor subunit [Sediminibacterium sp.]